MALEQVLDRLLAQGLGRALQGDGAGDFHPQGLPHPLGIGLPALAVVLAAVAGVEQLVKKGGAQQGPILQQPGGHLDGEPALPADAAAQPPLGPGVHLHLGCDVLAQGDAELPQLGGQLCQKGVQFLFFHKVLLSNLLGRWVEKTRKAARRTAFLLWLYCETGAYFTSFFTM